MNRTTGSEESNEFETSSTVQMLNTHGTFLTSREVNQHTTTRLETLMHLFKGTRIYPGERFYVFLSFRKCWHGPARAAARYLPWRLGPWPDHASRHGADGDSLYAHARQGVPASLRPHRLLKSGLRRGRKCHLRGTYSIVAAFAHGRILALRLALVQKTRTSRLETRQSVHHNYAIWLLLRLFRFHRCKYLRSDARVPRREFFAVQDAE
jgi:hypothetical protein